MVDVREIHKLLLLLLVEMVENLSTSNLKKHAVRLSYLVLIFPTHEVNVRTPLPGPFFTTIVSDFLLRWVAEDAMHPKRVACRIV